MAQDYDTYSDDQIVIEDDQQPDGPFTRYWRRMGGGSLTVSIALHAGFIILAFFLVWSSFHGGQDVPQDFVSGGGGGTEGNTAINKKRQRMMMQRSPAVKIASAAPSNVAIPETTTSMADIPTQTSGQMSGTPGSGGGFGGGHGKGRGTGYGDGFGPGKAPGFTAMFLGLLTSGNNIIFCIDTSGSMRTNLDSNGIMAIRREFKKVVETIPPNATFNLICFGHNGDIFKPKSVQATQDNKNEVIRFMQGYYGSASADFGRTRTEKYGKAGKDSEGIEYIPLMPEDVKELAGTEGGSRIDLAMVAAFERKPSTLFVLSDGAPGTKKAGDDKEMDKDDLIKLIHEKYKVIMGEQAKLTVNCITIESDTAEGKEGEQFMRKLAHKFGGKHKSVNPKRLK